MIIREIALEFLKRGGKKLRPRLCKRAFEVAREGCLGGGSCLGDFEKILEAIECFHKASLIHDDIQDGDEVRYGKSAVWKEYGVGVAIAAGDWLVAHGYQLIAESGFARAAEMLKVTVQAHIQLCEGQGDELAGAEKAQYLSICARKTGSAFALAAALGALAAGVEKEAYYDYGITFGVLFQIRDDLADGGAGKTLSELRKLEAEFEAKLRTHALADKLGSWYL